LNPTHFQSSVQSNTRPPVTTVLTLRMSEIDLSGLPATMSRSARLPASIVPSSVHSRIALRASMNSNCGAGVSPAWVTDTAGGTPAPQSFCCHSGLLSCGAWSRVLGLQIWQAGRLHHKAFAATRVSRIVVQASRLLPLQIRLACLVCRFGDACTTNFLLNCGAGVSPAPSPDSTGRTARRLYARLVRGCVRLRVRIRCLSLGAQQSIEREQQGHHDGDAAQLE
jgi:hypothetical protein